jgi:hypothetical protein
MSEGGPQKSTQDLSPDDARALAGVLDEIIPRSSDGRLPGAGELGLVRAIEVAMQKMPDLRPAVAQGLAALARLVSGRGAPGFAALPAEERQQVLNELAAAAPAFLPGLVFHTYAAYYRHGSVLEALGLAPRPPYPQGYPMEAGDLTRLAAVRRRGKLYRE